ncbi:N-acetylglucosamine kinase [Flaviaesturariibacter flavus]|uniref:N-acetylglucosamine kinase n=1 Tax=Flaviaesturariibacter flavus TaxID=2502780 RepID=A0A4R1BP47_9BACT|nr:N-acetylglucosamine kinase [Flaviaesturariibacter flavus]TCJ19106.1 N-acetylglucosamine kinase [Flaviaesturariibacter flavus]
MVTTLIADCGATKSEWKLLHDGKTKSVLTQGISPYFLSNEALVDLLRGELLPKLKGKTPEQVFYYGTGCANPDNARRVKACLKQVFDGARIEVETDLLAAARAVCGSGKGLACILGTGSNSCFYNGKKITRNSPGLGYVLGDEGSGAYLGRKVLQYFLYNTFDEDLRSRFDARFTTTASEILDHVYKQPMPNRYLASFAIFLAENRDHYMIENIIEDGLNDFFFQHLNKYPEIWKYPVGFVGSVAWGFRDKLKELCASYEFELGTVLQKPMDGLVRYHKEMA